MNSNSLRTLRGQLLREVITLLLFAGLMLQSATAVAPDWWSTRGALMPDADSDDFAVANVGQLKTIAQKAAQEMNDSFPGGAGTALNAMVNDWLAPPASGVSRDDYAALTLGQLKTIAKPFYDRLAAVGLRPANTYPWTGTNPDDYALANLGQVKTVFAFQVPPLVQLATQTGIPSSQLLAAVQVWLNISLDQRAEDATLDDLDGDGISNLQEHLMGTPIFDPADIDGDRIPNTVEDLYPGILSKSRFADAVEDYDGDGVMNFEEIQLGLSLSAASSGRSDGLNDAQVLATHLKQTLPGTVREMAQRQLWDFSIYLLTDFDTDDGLLTDHPEWQIQADANANGLPDGWEAYIAAYVPPIMRTSYTDCDGDRMPDSWEYRYQLDLRDTGDAGYALFYSVTVPQAPVAPIPADYSPEDYTVALAQYQSALADYTFTVQTDPDLDRLCNLREYYLGSNPRLADTNGDGTADEATVLAGNDPSGGGPNQGKEAQADDDGDGVPNAQELKLGIDPSQSNAGQDQDNDGFTDVEEALAGSGIFDSSSRSGPAILASIKSYGFLYDETQPFPGGTIYKRFSGRAYNDYGVEFISISEWDAGNSSDQGDAVRGAFNTGTFGGTEQLTQQAFPQIFFGNMELYRTWVSASTGGSFTHEGGGDATKFTIVKATIPTPPKVPWTRLYLVKKYTGSTQDYASESDMIFGDEMGIVVFSQDAEGNQSVTYQPTVADPAISNDGNSLIITPPQVENQIISYRLMPLEIEFSVPDLPEEYVTPLPGAPLQDNVYADEVGAESSQEKVATAGGPEPIIFKGTNRLNIAKLENSLNDGPPPTIDFASTEPEQFKIRIRAKDGSTIQNCSIIVQTYDADGDPDITPNVVSLQWDDYNKVLSSKSLLLVSDYYDRDQARDWNGRGLLYNSSTKESRVFKASGGGFLKIKSLTWAGNSNPVPIEYQVDVAKVFKTIPVTFIVLDSASADKGLSAVARVYSDIQVANERLLQSGIQIKGVVIGPVATPDSIKSNTGTVEAPSNADGPTESPDELALGKIGTPENGDDYVVFYVFNLKYRGDTTGGHLRGIARNVHPNKVVLGNAIINFSQTAGVPYVLAHELFHLFSKRGHYGGPLKGDYLGGVNKVHNLMLPGGTSENMDINGTKRIFPVQQIMIDSNFKFHY